MYNLLWRSGAAMGVFCAFLSHPAPAQMGNNEMTVPSVPSNLLVPTGHSLFLKAQAVGTQNYVCVPGASAPMWKFLGPQATLFVKLPWIQGPISLQVTTHFLSSNPFEEGTARPTWQSSLDTSAIWGKAIADSADPAYVAPGSIPWLLVEITGAQRGPMGGLAISQTTYIQRINTSGGVAPTDGCDASAYGKVALVPYTTDYYFYQARRK